MLTLDVAIVTRNRAQVLDLSLPLLFKQSRKPNNIVIVDSSDDPEAVAAVVKNYLSTTDIPITLIRSPAGIAVQRNVALEHVTSDIVMFPDDDSLLLPGALDAIMRIYEADVDERIGGVCGREVSEAPADLLSVARKSYEMTRIDRMKQLVGRQRFLLERRFLSDPIKIHGKSRWNVRATPEWLDKGYSVLVEYMTGCRMSFRTSVIKSYGFDESLGRFALFEDIDASFAVMQNHLIVSAENARIFHYKSPERRDRGLVLGVLQILNRAYILCRYSEQNSSARQHIRSFSRLKILFYAMDIKDKFSRDKFKGAFRAYRCLPTLLKSAPEDLTNTYLQLREQCLNGKQTLLQLPPLPQVQASIDLHPDAHTETTHSDPILGSAIPSYQERLQ